MTARLLDGASISRQILDEIEKEVASFKEKHNRPPGLGVILAGQDPASKIYVRRKKKKSEKLGMLSEVQTLPEESSTEDLLRAVKEMNENRDIDAFLVQLPLPAQVDKEQVLHSIDPEKDADGLHPENVGLLVQGKARFAPCTPAGVIEILDRANIPIEGKNAVIVGRSDIVGKPLFFMLLQRHATVTVCHSRTKNLPAVCAAADILIGATGQPAMITGEYIKEGAVVIDVGISRIDDKDRALALFGHDHPNLAKFDKAGYALVGDVHPLQGLEKAGWITPVPGGVGPLTIAMLMHNTLKAAKLQS
ncbi:bifunctional 5,10-methylenetetrahydrofolate dehydrogenase/5,10-methenyltetrahydrofolate cyclohydrolase [Acidobacteriota bacterium]